MIGRGVSIGVAARRVGLVGTGTRVDCCRPWGVPGVVAARSGKRNGFPEDPCCSSVVPEFTIGVQDIGGLQV